MVVESRQYDLVLLGATGYTGNLTAEYIQEHVSTDLKWAIAGRNASKLAQIAAELKNLNPDQLQPGVEQVEHNSAALQQLARKTKVLISTIGPFSYYGEPVVEACVKSGTHYFDITGETPFTFKMMHKYDELAKKNGVIVAPHSGVDSIPADVLTYICVKKVRDTYGVGVKECANVMFELGGGPSAGSLATMIALVEAYSFKFTSQALNPWALSPVPPPQPKPRTSPWFLWLFGSRNLKPLGIVANMPQAECDIGIVHRSWGLYDQGNYYGRKFHFNEYQYTGGRFKAFVMFWVLFWVQSGLRYFPPFRWLVKRILPTPGQGPPKADFKSYRTRFRAVATADSQPEHKVVANLHYKGSPYYLTGVLVVQAAMSLLNGGDSLAKKLKGYVTPATWGMELVDRMEQAGVEIDVAIVD